jgi:hypothetical protein
VTIAVCYLSAEGVVLGADSTSTWNIPGAPHYFNHGQKLFEIGEESTLGLVTWGLGALNVGSHRALAALLADDLKTNPPSSVLQVAERWVDRFWAAYTTSMAAEIQRCRDLGARPPFGTSAPNCRTEDEEREFQNTRASLVVGFCIGGYLPNSRTPEAFEMLFDPLANRPAPTPLPRHDATVWGVPNMVQRLMLGADDRLVRDIMNSGFWSGTEADILNIIRNYALPHPHLPMRDAIDYVHMCIFSTIKALKFSPYSQTCGGPIEIAVITADRKFRWVKHKAWDSAIADGETYGQR